ncbi:integrase, catalytic region, zinc finger, CCHC-type containing protein [Tanacetum coccineum]
MGLTEGKRGFEQTKTCYLIEVILFFKTIKEHFEGIQKAFINEIKEMKEVFDQMEVKVDQHAVDKKCGEIERKNLLIKNENALTSSDAPVFESVFVIENLKEKIQERGNTIRELKEKISRLQKKHYEADLILDFKALDYQNKYINAKVNALQDLNERFRIKGKTKCVTMPDPVKPKVLAPGTLREIIEEARVEKPLNSSLASACLYTGTLKDATAASGSKPRSNTKKDRILPAKSDKKKVKDHSRNNKSSVKQKNRVDSSISYKRNVINSNSNSICKTCNKCLMSFNHDKWVVKSLKFVKKPPVNKVVQIVLWYLDSGFSKHMMGDRSRLRNFVKKFTETVRFGNDHFGAIMGYGDYVIDLEVAFRKHSCYVRDVNGVDLIKGNRGTNLYTISVENMMKSPPICLLFTFVKFLRSKDETPEFVIKFLKQIQVGLNKTVRYIRTDNVSRTPQQNDVVKRQNRTLVDAARTMLIFSKALIFLWAEVVATACYTQNRSLIHIRHNKTSYELVHDKKPGLKFLCVERLVPSAPAVQVPVVSVGTSSSTTINQDAPSISYSPSTSIVKPPISHQGVAAGPTVEDNPFA